MAFLGRAGLLAWLVCRLHCADLCLLPAHQLSSKHDACVAHVRWWSPGIFYAGLRALEPGLGVAAAGRFAGGHSHKAGRLDRAELVPFASRTRAAALRRQVPARTRERSRGTAAMRGHGRRRRAERSCGGSRAAAGGIAGSAVGRPVARSAWHRRCGPSPCARAAPPTTRPLPPRARTSGGQAMRRSKHVTDCAPLPGLGTCSRERSRGAAAMHGHGRRRRAERSCGSSRAAAGGIAGNAAGRPVAHSAWLRRRGPSPCARAAPPTTRPLPPRARTSGGQAMRRSKHLTDCAPLPGLDACRQQLPRCMLMSVILHPCHHMCHLPRIRPLSPQPFTSCLAPAFAFSCPTWPPVRTADCRLAWSSTMRGGAADAMHCAWQALVCSRALGPLPYGRHVATRSMRLSQWLMRQRQLRMRWLKGVGRLRQMGAQTMKPAVARRQWLQAGRREERSPSPGSPASMSPAPGRESPGRRDPPARGPARPRPSGGDHRRPPPGPGPDDGVRRRRRRGGGGGGSGAGKGHGKGKGGGKVEQLARAVLGLRR